MSVTDRILSLMSPKDRKALGKSGRTAAEAGRICEERLERDIHRNIMAFLSLKGVTAYYHKRTDKKSTGVLGETDFAFCHDGRFVAVEVKLPGRKLDPEQVTFRAGLLKAGCEWYAIVYGLEDFVRLWNALEASKRRTKDGLPTHK